ncbi:GFA family protein [Chitinimonas sp. PSY-7]|uniref:GFA family protein n=1 Tax=Chitinimonas sp. PSY-7 TaxID=3459088 RepID=UPI0040403A73
MPNSVLEGGCQCGAIRYQVSGSPLGAAFCHCSMCRKANAAPAVAWALYKEDQVRFLHERPTEYHSSTDAKRGFCPRCGTQISFVANYIPGLIDITIGSMDDPNAVPPTAHYWESKRLSWVHFADQLPRYVAFPPHEIS